MKCSNCGNELTEEMFVGDICFNCGQTVRESVTKSEKDQEITNEKREQIDKAKLQAKKKADQEYKEQLLKEKSERFTNHKITTGYGFEDSKISKYLGLVSGEVVMGTGYFSDIAASISDFLGVEATEYSDKIKRAKKAALNNMITQSVEKGGNAIIGISHEYITFSGNMIGVSVNGTSVLIENENNL